MLSLRYVRNIKPRFIKIFVSHSLFALFVWQTKWLKTKITDMIIAGVYIILLQPKIIANPSRYPCLRLIKWKFYTYKIKSVSRKQHVFNDMNISHKIDFYLAHLMLCSSHSDEPRSMSDSSLTSFWLFWNATRCNLSNR